MATAPDSTSTPNAGPALAAMLRRRRARRLRVAAVAAVVLALVAAVGWQVGRQMVATTWLMSERVEVDWRISAEDWHRGGATHVFSFTKQFDPEDVPAPNLKLLTWLFRVETLDLSQIHAVGDADLAGLERLTDLVAIRLDRPSNLPSWRAATLPRLSDTTLARLRGMAKLQELSLSGQAVTDAGLQHLVGLDRLETLDLEGNDVTDAGLEPLRRLKGLKSVNLVGTRVTLEAAHAFEVARPGVSITVDGTLPDIR